MRPSSSQTTDKGKGIASTQDTYRQQVLGNLHFRPTSALNRNALERIHFGTNNLVFFPPSNLTFKVLPEYVIDKQQTCLVDNLWISHNRKDAGHFVATLNALCQYFTDKNLDKKFKFYVVVHGKTNGIFQTWIEVVDSIKDIRRPLFKGFNDFTEALDYARGVLGPNYYISPALRQNPDRTPQYNIQKDTDKVIFCDHCSTMTETVRRLNQQKETLIQEKMKLLEQARLLEQRLQAVKFELVQSQSSPSQTKMDETGVHSPMNANRSTVSDKDTASPVQTVAGKDSSNPLMAVTLPKSEDEGCSSLQTRRRLPKTLTQGATSTKKSILAKKKKNDNIESIVKETLERFFQTKAEQDKHVIKNPSPELSPSPRMSPVHSSEEGDMVNFQNSAFQDSQDPNNYDSGMSFKN